MVFIFALSWFVFPSHAFAATNPQINYQGKLTTPTGSAVANGTYNMRFWLLTTPSIATTSAVWTESLTSTNKVQVTDGLFSVMLGSTSALTGVNFSRVLYLGVEVGGTGSPAWDGEMSPRKILGSVPAAFESRKLGGVASTSFVRSDEADTIAASTATTLLTITQSGVGNILDLFDGATNVLAVRDGGNVGIGTTTPAYKLTVAGDARITGKLYDSANGGGTNGMVLKATATGFQWVATSTLGLTGGGGTISSLNGQSGATQTFASSTSGTDFKITSASNIHTFQLPSASASARGLLTATDWISFNGRIASTSLDTSLELANLITNETGSGRSVFSNSPAFSGTATFAGLTATGTASFATTTQSGRLTLSGTAANIALGTNYLSGDGGDEGIYIDSIGRVGMGTTTPTAKLTVTGVGTTTSKTFALTDSTGKEKFKMLDNGTVFMDGGVGNPMHKGSIINGAGGALLNNPNSVFVSGNYAYVASYFSNALEIVDVSNPASPVHKGSLANGVGGALLANPSSVFVSGNYAYVASEGSDALEIVDISNPANPVHKGSLANGVGGALLNDPYSVFVSGNYAYVASYSSNALEIVDISNPANPVHKGSLANGVGGALLANPYSVFVSGNYAYVASHGDDALEIIDLGGSYIANAEIGSLNTDTLQVGNFAQFNQNVLINSGLNVGGNSLFGGSLSVSGSLGSTTQSSPALAASSNDRRTNSITDILSLTHTATGTIANGIGTGLLFRTEFADTAAASTTATSSARIAALLTDVTASSPQSALSFFTKSGKTDLVERMRLTATGNLGIGSTTPSSKLTVVGTAASTQDIFAVASSTNTKLLTVKSTGNVGIGTTTPAYKLTVAGDTRITGKLYDSANGGGTNGMVLKATATGFTWVATSTLGLGTGSGSVTSVALAAPTGFSVSGSPVTSSGTLTLSFAAGYEGLRTASSTNWNNFYNTPSTRITDGTGLTWSTNALNCDTASGSTQGCLTSADWTSFNGRIASSALNTSVELANLITDETGSGTLVFGTAPTLSSTTISGIFKLSSQTASRALFTDAQSRATTTALSATLLNSLTDETGTGVAVFNTNPLLAGFRSNASSTIGGGTSATGLTVFGNATTTGNAYFASRIGIGSTSPQSLLTIDKNSGLSGSIVAGIKERFTFSNSVANAVYFGDNAYIVNAPTATSTLVGKIIRIQDNTALGNVVRGLEVQANRGSNTKGENTAISGFGRTFGVRGTTDGDAGGLFEPAGLFGETRGTTQSNAIRGSSASITTSDLMSLYHATSTFAGTGLLMNFGNGPGSFSSSTSRFIDLQVAGVSKFSVMSTGATGIGTSTPSSKLTVVGTAGSQQNIFTVASSTGTHLFSVKSTGRVSIGTTTSSDMNGANALTVVGAAATDVLRLVGGSSQAGFYMNSGSTFNGVQFGSLNNTGVGIYTNNGTPSLHVNVNGGTSLGSYAASSGGSNPPANGLIVSGSIGIGTSSPSSKLAVVGTAGSTQDIFSVASSTNTKLFTVLRNGSVTIGTTSARVNIGLKDALTVNVSNFSGYNTFYSTNSSRNSYIVTKNDLNYGMEIGIYASAVGSYGILQANRGLLYNFGSGIAIAADNAPIYFSAASGVTEQMRLTTAGNFGIGTTTTSYRLNVASSTSSTYVARIANTNTSNTADGLLISLSVANASRGAGNYFVGFSDGAGTVAGKIQGGASAVAYTTTAADLAEYFPVDDANQMPEAGEIVALDPENSRSVVRAEEGMVPFGIVTTNPGFIGNGPICKAKDIRCDEKYAEKNALISLVGQVPLKVSDENGTIAIGDSVTISSEDGVGMKASFGDTAVGYALETFDGSGTTTAVMVFANLHTALGMNPSEATLEALGVDTDVFAEESVMDKLLRLASRFVNDVLTVAGIRTNELCIGDTCVNEAQLIDVLQQIESSSSESGGGSDGGGGDDTGGGTGDGTGDGGTGTTTDDGTGGGGEGGSGGDTPPDPQPEPPPTESPPPEVTPEEDPSPEPTP